MLTIAVLLIAAFVFALCSVAAMIVVVGVGSRWPGRLFSYLMWMILIASVGTIVLSERVLKVEQKGLVIDWEGEIGGTILAKLLLVAVIGFSVALCAAWALGSGKRSARNSRFKQRGLCPPNDIVIAFMVFYVALSILPLIFGGSHHFHVSLVYPFFVFLALFLWVQLSSVEPVVVMKQCLAVIVLSSLAAAVVAPNLAIQPGYVGLIPGFTIRLWGLTGHANGLGSMACALLILEAAEPSARAWVKRCILAAAGLALILSQSKTSIVAAFFGLFIIAGWRLLSSMQAKAKIDGNQSPVIPGVIVICCAFVTISGVWVMFSDTSLLTLLERQLEGRAVDDLTTGTGRTFVWEKAIQGGMEYPLFGQGLDFWRMGNRLRWGLTTAGHAHNQFVQVFSTSGFIGLATLSVLLYFFFRYSVRAAKVTRGGSIAVLTAFFVRTMTEVPISPNSVLGGEFFAMMTYFIYVMDRGAKQIRETHARSPLRVNLINPTGIR